MNAMLMEVMRSLYSFFIIKGEVERVQILLKTKPGPCQVLEGVFGGDIVESLFLHCRCPCLDLE